MISTRDIDRIIGAEAVDGDDDRIGKVGQVYVEEGTDQPTWVSVRSGLFGMSETLVPLEGAQWDETSLHLAVSKQQVKDAPRVDPDADLTPDEQMNLYAFYGLGDAARAEGQAQQDTLDEADAARQNVVDDQRADRDATRAADRDERAAERQDRKDADAIDRDERSTERQDRRDVGSFDEAVDRDERSQQRQERRDVGSFDRAVDREERSDERQERKADDGFDRTIEQDLRGMDEADRAEARSTDRAMDRDERVMRRDARQDDRAAAEAIDQDEQAMQDRAADDRVRAYDAGDSGSTQATSSTGGTVRLRRYVVTEQVSGTTPPSGGSAG